MKTIVSCFSNAAGVALLVGLNLAGGCATGKPHPDVTHQRGWIGGEYKLAVPPEFWHSRDAIYAFPKSLPCSRKSGILVTALSTNTPARLAGLREGDLILDVNHQPVTDLADFRREIERSASGTWLQVSVWRDGQMVECSIAVGKETYKNSGSVSIGVFYELPRLVPKPGFSWIALGYDAPGTWRRELGSVNSTYRRVCAGGKYEPDEQDWAVWLGVLRVSRGKTILAQENPTPALAPSPQLAP